MDARLGRILVDVTARTLRAGRAGVRGRARLSDMDDVTVARVAYDRPEYPGVVLGSVHGSATYLAAGLEVPWLPTGPASGLPVYRHFLATQLARGGFVLFLYDVRSAVADDGDEAWLREWAHAHQVRMYRILYGGPDQLAAAAADVQRECLRRHGLPADDLVIACGDRIDPAVLRCGRVGYWCSSDTPAAVAAAALWLAGAAFGTIEVVVGSHREGPAQVATVDNWSVLANFALRRGVVNRVPARANLRSWAFSRRTHGLPTPPVLELDRVLAGLRKQTGASGHLVAT